MANEVESVLISQQDLQRRIQELGKQLTEEYAGRNLLLLGVLKGAVVFLVDEKVPRGERDGVPVVATPNGIIWVAGYRIDDRFKVTPRTRRVLKLRYEQL